MAALPKQKSKGAEYFRVGKKSETLLAETFPYFMPFVKVDDLSTPEERLCDRLWTAKRSVSYYDVHRIKVKDKEDSDSGKSEFEKHSVLRKEEAFDPQFERLTFPNGKPTVSKNVKDARVCDAVIQRDLTTGKYILVEDWLIVDDDYVANDGCRFELLNIKFKNSTATVGAGGTVRVSGVRTEVCTGRAVSESMSLIGEGMLNLAFMQEVAMPTSGAGSKAYVVYAFNYTQVREYKGEGTALCKYFGDLKHGESISHEKGSMRLELKTSPFLKALNETVNLDDVQFGFDARCIEISANQEIEISDDTVTLV